MDINEATANLEALADGINPTTGELLPTESVFNSPEVIRSLYTAVQHIRNPPPKVRKTPVQRQEENIRNGLPRNAGMRWDTDLKQQLADDFGSGLEPKALAEKYERTRGSIISELKKQGLITEEQAGRF